MRINSYILAVLGFVGAVIMSSCQSLHSNGATREEKSATLAALLPVWKQDELVNQFAQPRTTQIFNNLELDATQRHLGATSTGLATILTSDGYALTAAHVLDDGPASILTLRTPRRGQLTLTSAGTVLLSPDHPNRPSRVSTKDLKAHPIRLVHRFRGTDLALIKLPLHPGKQFHLANTPPTTGATLFSYGSNISGNSSAGKTLRVSQPRSLKPAATIWSLTTSIPLQKGDSGGPVMNPDGSLAAIISRGQTDLLANRITATIAVGISPKTLRNLIDADRANH